MGSNDHYPEEAPTRQIAIDGFWMDTHQVTNAQFGRFVEETGHVTVAECQPDQALYPDAPPENLVPGSLVFHTTDRPVDLRHINLWWTWTPGACWQHPEGPGSDVNDGSDTPSFTSRTKM